MHKQTLKSEQANISLLLDSYDDIFSDFDPRPYDVRALSDDFLVECKKAALDKGNGGEEFELRLLVPKEKRNLRLEKMTEGRLRRHFHKHFRQLQHQAKRVKRTGVLWFFFGAALLALAGWLISTKWESAHYILVVLEPAGWFTLWNGLDQIFFGKKPFEKEFEFYEKMSRVSLRFIGL